MNELYLRYKSIALFDKTAAAIAPLAELCVCTDPVRKIELSARVLREVSERGCDTTGEWIRSLIYIDDNVFSRTAARAERIPERLKAQVKTELLTFKQLSLIKPDDYVTDSTAQFFPRFGFGGFSVSYDRLLAFYAASGYGRLACGNTFIYRDGEITRTETDGVRLFDLKDYEEEKAEIVRNTENFINGLPAFHTLLYGDRGTGKSTTVRALAQEYKDALKIIEVAHGDIGRLPSLKAELSGLKQKFILFIDDLVFEENETKADEFKTALEGSLDSVTGNTLIYCTSNRRHLFKETDKTDYRHRNDEIQAELALFDRFGLVVTYVNPDKEKFVEILKQILRSRGIKWRNEYAAIAEISALKKGGRSPRAAKQIADIIESTYAEKRGD
ncbi:MAG: DUF815 domain-containing protein [Clostridiales bacterium]|nr:DUF815 domain-containing protein [Clostridiales bacterium]